MPSSFRSSGELRAPRQPSLRSRQRGARRLAARRSFRRPLLEGLEPRMMLAADDVISVGRFLSAYSTADVQNNELKITYSVFNQQASEVSGTLLTTTLQPGVTFKSATQLPDQNGQELAWSLGTIAPFGRASVEMTVSFAGAVPLVLDDGAEAFGTVDARAVSDDAPAARLRNTPIDAALLASTPDANTSDPFIRAKAAQLDHDPNQIFQFLAQEVGYESYVGSLRGARGTLWSSAGNSLDEASLGIALLRASGIPARYAEGTLSDELSQKLILSMFSERLQQQGYLKPGTPAADPANDSDLLGEARQHFWVQFDVGSGFVHADSALASSQLGQSYTAADTTFSEVADILRQKTTVRLNAETLNLASGLFGGLGGGPTRTTVLEQTFNDVELVGHPLTIGNFVNHQSLVAIFTAVTNTYSPYIAIGDDAFPDVTSEPLIRGQDYQETLTNFPFGSRVLTGLFLEIDLQSPDGESATYERTLLERIGFANRKNGTSSSLPISPEGLPAFTSVDVFTLNVLPGAYNPQSPAGLERVVEEQRQRLDALVAAAGDGALPPEAEVLQRSLMTNVTRLLSARYFSLSDAMARDLSKVAAVKSYFDAPRLVIVSGRAIVDEGSETATAAFGIDLRSETVRALAGPGQSEEGARGFSFIRGVANTSIEAQVIASTVDVAQAPLLINAQNVIDAAVAQNIRRVLLSPDDMGNLDAILTASPDARARIADALAAGKLILAPEQPVQLGDVQTTAWYEIDPNTGDSIGVVEDGGHAASSIEYAAVLGLSALFIAGLYVRFEIGQLPDPDRQEWKRRIGSAAQGLGGVAAAAGFVGGIDNGIVAYGANANFIKALGAIILSEEFAIAGVAVLGIGTFGAGYMLGDAVTKKDPPTGLQLYDFEPAVVANHGSSTRTIDSNLAAGEVSGTVQATSTGVSGQLSVSWSGTVSSSFSVHSLSAPSATVRNSSGAIVGSGVLSLADSTGVSVAVSGNVAYSASGSGSLSLYAAATTNLGVSGGWEQYTASLTGSSTLVLTSDSLTLNGVPLPVGAYSVSAASATLAGDGPMSASDFAGSVSIDAIGAVLQIGKGTGNISIAGTAVNAGSGVTLMGYTGSLEIDAGSTADALSLDGNAAQALYVSAIPSAHTTDQNSPIEFDVNVHTNLAGSYAITAQAPIGWMVAIADNGVVTVTPAPGVQGGDYTVYVSARSQGQPELVAQSEVTVHIVPTQAGITLSVEPDPIFTVPYQGTLVPTAFKAVIHNDGPVAEIVDLTFSGAPPGFSFITSTEQISVPAGSAAVVGVYLKPTSQLPLPGTPISFSVAATSTTDPAVSDTELETFLVPAIHGVVVTTESEALTTVPGAPVTTTITLTAVGNVAEHVSLAVAAPDGLTVTSLAPVDLSIGQPVTRSVTFTPSAGTPLGTILIATIDATFAPPGFLSNRIVEIPVTVELPAVGAVTRAANAAVSLGNDALAQRLGDLRLALTNLNLKPDSETYKSQAVAALDAVIGLMQVDEVLVGVVPGLKGPRDALAAAVTESEVLAALNQVGGALDGFGDAVQALANSNFELFLLPNSQVALPGAPVQFAVRLHNVGLATSTYNVTLGSLPAGVTGTVSSPSVTLDRDGFATNLIVTLTPPANEVFPFEFQVNVAVNGAPQIAKAAVGTLTVRSEFLSIVEVKATPAFVDPGTPAAISARLLNSVNRKQNIRVAYTVKNSSGQEVLAPPPINSSLEVNVTLFTLNLADLSTAGLPVGQYTINVQVTDENNNPLPGGTGTGSVFIGSPVTATLTTSPQDLPPGTSTITNTLEVQTQTLPLNPPDLLGQVAVAGATDAARNGNFVYVAGSAGISVFNIAGANVENPQFVRVVGTATNVLEIRNNLLVAVRQGLPNSRLDTYSLTDPSNPQFLGTTGEIPYSSATDIVVTDTHVFVAIVNLVFNSFNNLVLDQPGGMYAVNISNPAAPFFDGDAITLLGTPAGRDGVNDGVLFNDFGTSNDGIGVHAPIDMSGGRRMMWDVVQVAPTILYLMGSSATGTDTQSGVGQVHVVDISDPRNMRVLRQLAIPGTVHAFGIAVNGNRALVTATEGGVASGTAGHPFTGNIVLATLDISDPANPQIIHTQELPDLARGITFNAALGNGQYAFGSLGETGTNAQLNIVDARDPRNLVVSSLAAPANPNASAAGDLLLTTDRSNLIIYRTPSADPLRVVGQAAVTGAADAVRNGDFVYVAGSGGISVLNVAGANLANPQLVRTVAGAANIVRVRGDKLYALRNGNGNFVVSIYSLTDPSHPTLLGATPSIPYAYAINMVVTDTKVYVVNFNVIFFLNNNDIFDHNGAVVTIDVTDPANPQVDGDAVSASGTPAGRDGVNDGVLFNENGTSIDGIKVIGGVDQSGGNRNTWDAVQLDATTMLVVGSTATGGDTQTGSGIVQVVDTTDPQNLRVLSDLLIPGTVQGFSIAVEGNRALVVASTGGFQDFSNASNNGFTGTVVLATLDITNPRNPLLLNTEITTLSSRVLAFHESLGNGMFAIGLGETSSSANNSQLYLIDNSNLAQPLISSITVPSDISRLSGGNGLIYTASPDGLIIYEPSQILAIPVMAQVQIPKNTNVNIVPASFNVPPDQIISGPDFDTLVWNTTLASGAATKTFTWQSTVNLLQPGEGREVTLDSTIDFTLGGTARQLTLPPQLVAGKQILNMNPGEVTVFSGQRASYSIGLSNPTSVGVTYDLAVEGVPEEWVTLSRTQVFVPPNSFDAVGLFLQSDPFAPASRNDFVVTATTGGVRGSVQATLRLAGEFLLPADPQSHGVVVSLLPETNTAGQGTAAHYTFRVTNTGSATDAFLVQVNGLPPEFDVSYQPLILDLPPGASNYRDYTLSITPPSGTLVGEYPFTVMASWSQDIDIASEAFGTLDVVAVGVDADILQDSVLPGGALQLVVQNTGSVAETFDLSLAGPAALISTLAVSSVTLQPGGIQTVTIQVGAIDFAIPGALQLVASAKSRTVSAVGDSDSADVTIAGTLAMTAAFEDATIEQPQIGSNPFLLLVENLGNLEDSYIARIVSTRGLLNATFVGLDGAPTQTIPLFILPGLATGAIQLNAFLASQGGGDVTVEIRSLTNDQIVAQLTATLGEVGETPPVITTLGGGDSASVDIPENTTLVVDVEATGAAPLVYSIVGGADAAKFSIDANTGVLSFLTPPNFEAPTDNGGNNIYDVIVQVNSGDLFDSQTIAVRVTNANDAPLITSNDGGTAAAITVAENTTFVTDVNANDPDGPTLLTYSISGGADAARFTINATSGVVSFATPPNFESPADVGNDNVYEVVVQVSDGSLTDVQTLSVSVTNVNEAPTITSNNGGDLASVSVSEGTTVVTDVNATDPDASFQFTFSLAGGADAAKFTMDPASGVLSFLSPPNFEAPTDSGGNNVYDVIVRVSDGSLADTQTLAVSVTNVNEPPTITSNGGGESASVSVTENTSLVTDVNASDPDGVAGLTFSIAGGVDAARFSINPNTGVLSFVAPPNFELPTDADGNNVYQVTVQVSDGNFTDTQALTVTVTDANEQSAFLAIGADAGSKSKPIVKVYSPNGVLIEQFTAYTTKNFKGGVRVAVGDVTGDGIPDIVTVPGRGHAPLVKVFDGRTILDGVFGNVTELGQFQIQAYAASFKDGMYVAVGDVIGDGLNDIIVSPERGKTEIRVFQNLLSDPSNPVPGDPFANTPAQKFLPFAKNFCGGATVAVGDVDRFREKQEIIVGNGSGMRTQVKAYNVAAGWPQLARTYSPFANSFRGGVFVAAGDVNGDGLAEVIAGAARGGGSRVEIFDGASSTRLQNFVAYNDKSKQSSVRVAAKDTDGDGDIDGLFVGQAADGKSKMVRRIDPLSTHAVDFLFLNDSSLGGGFFLG